MLTWRPYLLEIDQTLEAILLQSLIWSYDLPVFSITSAIYELPEFVLYESKFIGMILGSILSLLIGFEGGATAIPSPLPKFNAIVFRCGALNLIESY